MNNAKQAVLTWRGVLRGMAQLLPIAVFVLPFGLGFGVAAIDTGVSASEAVALSAIAFSGAAQFATLDFWTSPVAFGSLALVVLAVNARHLVMGAAIAPYANTLPLAQRILTMAFLSDANFATMQGALKRGERDLGLLLGGGVMLWLCWVAGTVVGVGSGAIMGDPKAFGVDVVMGCFFAAVAAGQARDAPPMLLAVAVAAGLSAALFTVLPAGWNVIVGALAGGVVGMVTDAQH